MADSITNGGLKGWEHRQNEISPFYTLKVWASSIEFVNRFYLIGFWMCLLNFTLLFLFYFIFPQTMKSKPYTTFWKYSCMFRKIRSKIHFSGFFFRNSIYVKWCKEKIDFLNSEYFSKKFKRIRNIYGENHARNMVKKLDLIKKQRNKFACRWNFVRNTAIAIIYFEIFSKFSSFPSARINWIFAY